ncbi:MAG: iron-containing alcohol dehydrogenase [Verrucomicrobia bacterium]|nr:iron-containing alcohol dehydrogenase [Verrucomicrobiota bacterium]
MRFEFATASRVVFGPGSVAQAGSLARELGRHAFVVTGRDPRRAARLLEALAAAPIATTACSVGGEPSTDDVVRATAQARAAGCDCVIGFGGGSAIDTAKAVSALLTNGGELADYLEVIGRAQPLARAAAPGLAIPTTAGTGAEVTRNAVLFSPPHRVKVSLRSLHLLPRIALVDPELTHDLPPALTAATGLDALTQLIEPYTSCRAQPLTDALCVEGLRRAARSLRRACDDGRNAAARTDLALASLFGGFALANAGLGAVHGFAGPIGGLFAAPHGAVCAALLPHVMAANLGALHARAPQSEMIRRYDEVARLLTGAPHATAVDGVRWVAALVADLGIRPLSACGLTPARHSEVVAAAARSSSMKANPIALTDDELAAILRAAG